MNGWQSGYYFHLIVKRLIFFSHSFVIVGGLSMAVPGELRGLEMAWKRWGKLEWKDLFQSSIDLARNGFPVSATISTAIQSAKASVSSGKFPGLL